SRADQPGQVATERIVRGQHDGQVGVAGAVPGGVGAGQVLRGHRFPSVVVVSRASLVISSSVRMVVSRSPRSMVARIGPVTSADLARTASRRARPWAESVTVASPSLS